jgi:hypothetical protein
MELGKYELSMSDPRDDMVRHVDLLIEHASRHVA